jgi:isopenicillin N synthase-like dioxygenase
MTVTANIPIIDLAAEEPEGDIAKKLADAAIEHGFIYIKNMGADIPVEKVEGAFDMVRGDLTPRHRGWMRVADARVSIRI